MRVCPVCGSPRVDDAWRCAECGNEPPRIDGFRSFAPDLAADSPGFREHYFGDLAAIEDRSFWFRARNELIIWILSTEVPEMRTMLEIGCGNGFVLAGIRAAFPSVELAGSEVFTTGLGYAAVRVPTADLNQMDARNIPFVDHFDVIGAFDVLEHIEDDTAVIASVVRALRPGGSFVMTVPQHPALWSDQDDAAHHVRRYTARSLRHRLEAAGLEVVRATSFVSLLLPLMVAARRLRRRRQPDGQLDAVDELRQPRVVGIGLEAVMRVERALIRAGLSFPAGGSLLMVARKPVGSARSAA